MYFVASVQPEHSVYDVIVLVFAVKVHSCWKDGIFQIVIVHFGSGVLVTEHGYGGEDNLVGGQGMFREPRKAVDERL